MQKNLIISILLLYLFGCKIPQPRQTYSSVNALLHQTDSLAVKPFLKAHMKNGEVYVFEDKWEYDSASDLVKGMADKYDVKRQLVLSGNLNVPVDSVALFETNQSLDRDKNGRILALTILTGVNLLGGAICLTNPKVCFGSCPTFYVNGQENIHDAVAEGFSNAISPSLAYMDIDDIRYVHDGKNNFRLTMKNEALETHCLYDVNIMAVPVSNQETVLQSSDQKFYICQNIIRPFAAKGEDGDLKELLSAADQRERISLSHPEHLDEKETIFLEFRTEDINAQNGLILHFRQSLMTTYLIYQAMGYMGDEVGDVFSKLEIDGRASSYMNNHLKKVLGKIDIYLYNDQKGKWLNQGSFYETGPIAINRQMLPLDSIAGRNVKIKIVMNKGLWRLDYAALATNMRKVDPIELKPFQIHDKNNQDVTHKMVAGSEPFISLPGDEFNLDYQFPDNRHYALFLKANGYYIEWMRKEWLEDKDLSALNRMLFLPKQYLREVAPEFKKYESQMEAEFWNSRINTKVYSYGY